VNGLHASHISENIFRRELQLKTAQTLVPYKENMIIVFYCPKEFISLHDGIFHECSSLCSFYRYILLTKYKI
jgi:hypothetical protein